MKSSTTIKVDNVGFQRNVNNSLAFLVYIKKEIGI